MSENDQSAETERQASDIFRVSHMTFPEALAFAMQLRTKVEGEWQRVVNVHAALIVVMIFFAGQQNPYIAARIVVYVFYTFNIVVSLVSLRESYDGLRHVSRDLKLFPPSAVGGHSMAWLQSHNFRHAAWLRAGILALVWALVGNLLLVPLILGKTLLGP